MKNQEGIGGNHTGELYSGGHDWEGNREQMVVYKVGVEGVGPASVANRVQSEGAKASRLYITA